MSDSAERFRQQKHKLNAVATELSTSHDKPVDSVRYNFLTKSSFWEKFFRIHFAEPEILDRKLTAYRTLLALRKARCLIGKNTQDRDFLLSQVSQLIESVSEKLISPRSISEVTELDALESLVKDIKPATRINAADFVSFNYPLLIRRVMNHQPDAFENVMESNRLDSVEVLEKISQAEVQIIALGVMSSGLLVAGLLKYMNQLRTTAQTLTMLPVVPVTDSGSVLPITEIVMPAVSINQDSVVIIVDDTRASGTTARAVKAGVIAQMGGRVKIF